MLSAHSNYVVRFLNEDNEPEPVLANCVMRDNTCETITWSLTIMRSDGDDDDKVRAGDDLSYTFNDEKADDARSNYQYDYSNHLIDGVSINRKTNGNNNNNNSPKEQPILITPTKPKGKSNHLTSYLYYNKELDCTKVIDNWKNDFRDVWEMKCQVPNISPKTPNISPSLDSPAVLSYSPQLHANNIPVAISSLSPSSLRIDGSNNNNMLEFKLDSPPSSSSRRLDESSHSRQHMIYDGKSKALSDSKYCGGNDRENIDDGDDPGL